MNLPYVVQVIGSTLDQRYHYQPATAAQVRAVNIILRKALQKSGQRVGDCDRYAALGALLGHPVSSTKEMTKGQASAIIGLSNTHTDQLHTYLEQAYV